MSANTDIEMRVDKKAIKNLSSKQGAGTRDEVPLTIYPMPVVEEPWLLHFVGLSF